MAAKTLRGPPLLRCRRTGRRRAVSRSAFTLLEVTVATVVLGIAMAGLFPLVVIMSRDLQPLRTVHGDGTVTYDPKHMTPARDGNTTGTLSYSQHTWYLAPAVDLTAATPNSNVTAWVRRLGSSARLCPVEMTATAPPTEFTSAATPNPVVPLVVQQDNYDGTPTSADGEGTFAVSGSWTCNPNPNVPDALDADTHRHEALPLGQTSTDFATWTLTVPADGWYAVQATWPAASDQVDDAVFTVFKNGVQVTGQPVVMVQSALPVGISDASGRMWADIVPHAVDLGRLVKTDVITVTLSVVRGVNPTEVGKYVVADAVRIAQNEVSIMASPDRAIGRANKNTSTPQADITVHATVTVNLPE